MTEGVTIHVGDVRDVLAEMPSASVDCVVTSPPYWALRDYGVDGQLGLEPTPDEYVANMVAVFREVRRVLADHGTCWVNLGDSYANTTSGGGSVFDNGRTDGRRSYDTDAVRGRGQFRTLAPGLKPKDLVGIPWRVAFALQADGWVLRSDVVWAKLNPMPESVTDRPTKAHEMIFLFSKAKWVGPPRGRFADISDEDARWLALLFDAEGNVSVKKAVNGDRVQYGAQIAFANTNRLLIERARSLVGAGSIHEREGTNAPMFYWQMTGQQARDLLYRIYPFLIVKPRQAAVAIHMQDVIAEPKKRPGGYRSEAHTEFLDKCWLTVKALNSFEHPDISWVPEPRYGKWDSQPYHFDQEAVREPNHHDGRHIDVKTTGDGSHENHKNVAGRARWPNPAGRNVRSVWQIATQPYAEAHFATFPEELPRRCILAGCPEWVCATCGKPRERITGRPCPQCDALIPTQAKECGACGFRNTEWREQRETNAAKRAGESETVGALVARKRDLTANSRSEGWSDCGHGNYRPGVVLDPFGGSGTVAVVARRLKRDAILVELNPEYAELARRRVARWHLPPAQPVAVPEGQPSLFDVLD